MSKTYSPVTTPPKGRPTPKRPRTIEQRNRSATLGWVAVGVVIATAIVAGAYFTRGSSGQPLH